LIHVWWSFVLMCLGQTLETLAEESPEGALKVG